MVIDVAFVISDEECDFALGPGTGFWPLKSFCVAEFY